jgi:type I restriction enzyme R subunit
MKLAIEGTLLHEPYDYDRQLYAKRCAALFERMYESFPKRNSGVCAAAI